LTFTAAKVGKTLRFCRARIDRRFNSPGAIVLRQFTGIRAPMVFLWLPMKRYLPYLIVGFVALATFGSGFALYRSKRVAPASAPKNGPASGMHVRGKAEAPVTIEEFGDFQCPPCSLMAAELKKAEETYGDKLRVIFHHFPLAIHAHAREAALYAEAAANQNHFWQMHDVIYKEQVIWSKAPDVPALFSGYAGSIGLDLERLKKDLANPEVAARVDADQKLGTSRDVTSTPTLFVNNVLLPPEQINPAGLKKAIDAALKEKEQPKG
jgi:protein-disulfide isomerase